MNCLIIEDDRQHLEKVVSYVRDCKELTLEKACQTLDEAKQILEQKNIDLLFLDVELQGGDNGLAFYQQLEHKPQVIVMTSHPGYAVDSYAEHLAGFLHKPFNFNQFQKMVMHVLSLDIMQKRVLNIERLDLEIGNYIPILDRNQKIVKVFFRDIVYLEQKDHDVVVYTNSQQYMFKRKAMREIESTLPLQLFQRVNKSIIVNTTYIEKVLLDVVVVGKHLFTISPKFKRMISEE